MAFNNIHDALQQWGKDQQHLPLLSDALKNQIMKFLPPKKESSARPRFHLPWFALSMSAVVLLAIITVPTLIRQQLSRATGSGFKASAPASKAGLSGGGGGSQFGLSYGEATGLGSKETFGSAAKKLYDQYTPYYEPEIPIADNREFLKTDYSAQVKTRRANELGTRVSITIRGLGGRVDNSSISDRYSYVSFVIPKDALPVLQSELKGMVNKVFFTEQIGTINLLGEKRYIEEQTNYTEDSLASLEKERQAEDARYKKSIAELNATLAERQRQLKNLEAAKKVEGADLGTIAKQEDALRKEEQYFRNRIARERQEQAARLAELDAQIRATKEQMGTLQKQDKNLIDTVETVRGTITLNWISIPEYLSLLLAPHWWLLPLAALALIVAKVSTRKRLPEVPLAPR